MFRKTTPTKRNKNMAFSGERQPKQLQLPKSKFHRRQQLQKQNKAELCDPLFVSNEERENANIEELLSSDEDDCVVYEPDITKIVLDDDEDDSDDDDSDDTEKSVASEQSASDNLPNTSGFVIDNRPGFSKFDPFFKKKPIVYLDDEDDDDECIVIEDSFDLSKRANVSPAKSVDERMQFSLLKPATPRTKSLDESVIFVEESKPGAAADFIPLPKDDDKPKKRKQKGKQTDAAMAVSKQFKPPTRDSFYTTKERKELADYNSNTYNPDSKPTCAASVTKKRIIIIDGSNVAFAHGCSNVFSSEGIKYCVEYFKKMGHYVKVIIPKFRINAHKSSNPEMLVKLHTDGILIYTPCKRLDTQQCTSYDDRFILQLAFELNAAIISNDNYRDLLNETPAFRKIIENRVIGYTWCDNILMLPKDPYGRFGPSLAEILHC